jgi:hypothetical protein
LSLEQHETDAPLEVGDQAATAGCEICSDSAARVTVTRSITARNVSIWRILSSDGLDHG